MDPRKPKSRQPSSEPQTTLDPADSPELVQLRNWIGAMDFRFISWDANVEVEVKDTHVNIYLYTKTCRYAIKARCTGPDRSSYLGCTVQGYGKHYGGRDMADGDFSDATWLKILSDIVSHELIPVAKGLPQIEWDKKTP